MTTATKKPSAKKGATAHEPHYCLLKEGNCSGFWSHHPSREAARAHGRAAVKKGDCEGYSALSVRKTDE